MNTNILAYFNQTVQQFPTKIAVDDNEVEVSFFELNEFSNRIAAVINSKFHINRKPVGVYLPKNRLGVCSFLGICKSGNFYVPIDIKSPLERISKILDNLKSDLIITDLFHSEILKKTGYRGGVILIEEALSSIPTEIQLINLQEISNNIIDTDPIYSIYTSGSTGIPKGVLISQKGVIDFIQWSISTYSINESHIIGNQVPFYFDVSTMDIYLMVFTGAKLIIIPEDRFTFPLKLIEFVNEKKINTICWVPSVLNNVSNFDVFSTLKPTTLQNIFFAGEPMSNKHLNYWRKNYPNALYANLYGPTEITVICTYYNVNRDFKDEDSLPIGKVCRNMQAIIVNEEGQISKKGEIGELLVRGSGLAFGYYNDPEKTSQSFVQNPLHDSYPDLVYKTGDLVFENEFDEIMFVGRKDSQIKHIGYRIELGEIENAILGIESVKNSCVLYDEVNKQIVAFYISEKPSIEIRNQLIKILPKYMIPTKWINLDHFPLNANGKIARLELKNQI
jgi:amino acid adenylation domain-containing protein